MTTALEKRCGLQAIAAERARDLKRVKALLTLVEPCFTALGCSLSIEESGCHGSLYLALTSAVTGRHLLWIGRDNSELLEHARGFLANQPGGDFWAWRAP